MSSVTTKAHDSKQTPAQRTAQQRRRNLWLGWILGGGAILLSTLSVWLKIMRY